MEKQSTLEIWSKYWFTPWENCVMSPGNMYLSPFLTTHLLPAFPLAKGVRATLDNHICLKLELFRSNALNHQIKKTAPHSFLVSNINNNGLLVPRVYPEQPLTSTRWDKVLCTLLSHPTPHYGNHWECCCYNIIIMVNKTKFQYCSLGHF